MSKSPLIKILRQAYRISKISRKTGIPPAELLDIFSQKISRRRFLQKGLAFSVGLSTTFLAHKTLSATDAKIAPVLVVGAGIAGLTAAYRLKQAGIPVDVIEARKWVGGRMRSLHKVVGTELTVELGGEFINTDHTCLRGLAQELGFKIVDLKEFEQGINPVTFYFEGRKLPLAEIIRDFAPVARQINEDLNKLENFTSYLKADPVVKALDSISITEYLNRIPDTTETIRQLIQVGYTTEYGLDAEKQSCLNLLYLIGTTPGEFSILGSSDERFYIDGGNDQIPRRLAQILGDSIETGTVLESISMLSSGRYRVDIRSEGVTKERKYEKVLLALPFSILRQIPLKVDLPPVKRLAIDNLGYGTNSKLITSYKEKIWRNRYNSAGSIFADLQFQNTWEASHSRYTGVEGIIINFTGGRQGLVIGTRMPEFHDQKLLTQLEKVFPGISKQRLPQVNSIRAYWVGEKYNRGSYSCYLVGQWTQIHGSERERVGNLFFAGEHTSVDFPGYMEGGCETGEAAALEIMQDLGLKASAYQQKIRLLNNGKQQLISK